MAGKSEKEPTRLGLLLEEAAAHHMQSVREQAAAMGISLNTLIAIKYGHRARVERRTLVKVASYLGVDVMRLNDHMLTGAALA
jgi:DNA-binding Xre family transcriptional regulator